MLQYMETPWAPAIIYMIVLTYVSTGAYPPSQ